MLRLSYLPLVYVYVSSGLSNLAAMEKSLNILIPIDNVINFISSKHFLQASLSGPIWYSLSLPDWSTTLVGTVQNTLAYLYFSLFVSIKEKNLAGANNLAYLVPPSVKKEKEIDNIDTRNMHYIFYGSNQLHNIIS